MTRVAVLIALLVSSCSSQKPARDPAEGVTEPTAPADGPVTLTFDWPAGLDGTLQIEGLDQKDGKRNRVSATYALSTTETDEGVAIRYQTEKLEMPDLNERARSMAEPLLRATPTVVVDEGGVVALGNFEDTKARLDEMLAPLYKEMPSLQQQMAPMLTEEFFLASTQDEWVWRGTAFHGRTMSVGESVIEETELPMLLVQGKMTAKILMTLEERLPCPRATDRQCVRLSRKLTVDPEAAKAALGKYPAIANNTVIERSIVSELVVEPSTLLTYELTKIETTNVTLGSGENQKSTSQRKETKEIYTWN